MSTAALSTPLEPRRRAPLFPGNRLLGAGPAFQARPIATFFDATAACGDVARLRFPISPYTAHILRHPDGVQQVLADNARNYGKQTRGYAKLRDILGNGLVTSEGDFWKRQRRIANPAFHRERIAHFGAEMVRCAGEMVDAWQPRLRSGEPFDLAHETMLVTLRIIGITMLSTDVQGQGDTVGRALDDVLHVTIQRVFRILNAPAALPTPQNRRFSRGIATLNAIVNRLIAERRAAGAVADSAGDQDLLGMLMAARDPESGEGMNDTQLRDEAMTMFLAGHETTANALAWTFYLLSRHPEVARRLQAEVASALDGRPPTLADLPKLPFSERVIKESMRLFPPVWSIGRSAIEEDVIGGFHIPKGSWIFMSPYLTHRDPRFWPNPEGFDPDRFLPEEDQRRPKGAYFPFAFGPRKCLGETFAMMEARLILATVVQRVELSLVPGYEAVLDPTITLRPKGGLWMTGRLARGAA